MLFYFCLFFATVVWGVNVIIDRKALHTGHPIEVHFITTMTMACFVALNFFLSRRAGYTFSFHSKTMLFSMLNGLLIPSSFLAYLYALSKGQVNTVVLVTASYPVIAILLAVFTFQETLSGTQLFGILLTIIGVFLVIR